MAGIESLVKALLKWFAASARELPWRRTRDPYAIWVSEIMLQQTQVKTVIPYWERWLRELPTVAALASASPDKIHKLWEGLGYYTRVRNMQKAAQQIVRDHVGQFPNDFAAVLALPGIGRYTAGAICSIAFNQPTPLLDGNVIRVLTRVFGIATDPKEKTTNARLWHLAEQLVQQAGATSAAGTGNSCSHLNQSLMELGALVCTPKQARCGICPIQTLCVAFRENRVAELPNLGRRVAATERRFLAMVVQRNGKFLVRQRPADTVNAHLWEFPNMELAPDATDPAPAVRPFRLAPHAAPLTRVKHTITRYRITVDVYPATLPAQAKATPAGRWLTLAELDELAFTSAHRKILRHLQAAAKSTHAGS
ncbi:MAG TPA: A/G-specific adenine glycosylase [Dongiaceae bacterium]|nr:A/G-specific adenine glycosylase [Dongiaceae bacterium]